MKVSMKVRIDKKQCVGNARCQTIAPQLYPLDDEGYIDTSGFDVAADAEKAALNGAKSCPERIIFVLEDKNGEERQLWPPVKA